MFSFLEHLGSAVWRCASCFCEDSIEDSGHVTLTPLLVHKQNHLKQISDVDNLQ